MQSRTGKPFFFVFQLRPGGDDFPAREDHSISSISGRRGGSSSIELRLVFTGKVARDAGVLSPLDGDKGRDLSSSDDHNGCWAEGKSACGAGAKLRVKIRFPQRLEAFSRGAVMTQNVDKSDVFGFHGSPTKDVKSKIEMLFCGQILRAEEVSSDSLDSLPHNGV